MPRVQLEFDQVFTPVSHTNSLPLYTQVIHQVEDALRRNRITVGDYLPPEPVLCDGFGIARSTLRRAVGQLISRGVVSRKQGDGTQIVHQVQMDYSAATSVSLHADLRAAERNPRTRVMSADRVVAGAELSTRTKFPIGTRLLALRRLRLAGEVPIAVLGNHLLASVVDLDPGRLVDASLDDVLRANHVLTRTIEYEINAALATDDLATALDIAPRTPLLRERRWAYTEGDTYVNYSENYYHPTSFHFRGVLTED